MSCLKQFVLSALERYRGLVVLFFCLPTSFVFNWFLFVIDFFQKCNAKESHDEKVRDIQSAIGQWNKLPWEEKKCLCTARPNWLSLSTTFFKKDNFHKISLPLYNILALDKNSLSVKVEPFVKVKDITSFLIPKGYALAVHLEIGEATLGGLAMGVGMTTHSHKVGLYQETIISFDVVMSDGSLIHATKYNEHSDLFKALPWSHGTLGFIVALELQIIPAKPYVHLSYIPVNGQQKYCSLLQEMSGANNKDKAVPDFIEGTIFSKEEAVILVGWFSDKIDKLRVNKINKWYKPWFYKYVEEFLSKGHFEELVPIEDYLLRHNRSIFWVIESMLPFGNNFIFRVLLGWLLPPNISFLKLTTTSGIRKLTVTKQVFQDIVLPLSCLQDQVNLSDELFSLYPLLVYPCRVYDWGPRAGQIPRPPSHALCPNTNYAMYNDLGIYGVPGYVKRKTEYKPVEAMRKMEAFTRAVGGFSFLYADIFMTRSEFEQMFDLQLYEEMRQKYSANLAFPHLYDKVKPEINVFDLEQSK